MRFFTSRKRVEFEALGALFAVIILNIVIFASLSSTKADFQRNILAASQDAAMLYGAALVCTLLFILLNKTQWIKFVFYTLLGILTSRIISSLYSLTINRQFSDNGQAILTDAFFIWTASLLVFSMWYWLVDRGGPVARKTEDVETRYDLLFPQYQAKIPGWEHWHPKFLDYVFFSFFTSTGFSPADTLPLTKRVKLLMMLEASISLIIIGMIASRAISLIH